MQRTVTSLFYLTTDKFIQGNICENKKEIIKFSSKLSMKEEFNKEKCKHNYKSHTYKFRTMIYPSINIHLQVSIRV